MGKGRAPCCDKSQVKRGPWSPEEDLKLITFIQKYGHENWRALPKQAGLVRCGKSCRLRWINYLRPDVRRGNFTREEEETIIRLHEALGNKWSKIASLLPGRTDNEIKNVWNTHLKKRLPKSSESSSDESKPESSVTFSSSSSSDSLFSSTGKSKTVQSVGNEYTEQASTVTMTEKIEQQDSEKQVANELNGITEDPKESPVSFSSVDSNLSNSSPIVNFTPEEQMDSLFDYLGPMNNASQVNKLDGLLEIPMESSDYDLWSILDNNGSFQSNEANLREESVEDAENRKWFHDLENELGLGETEKNQDKFQPKNDDAAEPVMNPQAFNFESMKKSEFDPEMAFFESSWPSWPEISGLLS